MELNKMNDKENNTYNVGDGFDIIWENNVKFRALEEVIEEQTQSPKPKRWWHRLMFWRK